jgi:ADP-ribose pyrophosphatase YjhB (NUDIX family)
MKKDRFKLISAVHLLLFRKNGKEVLLSRRFNTGWQDGNYSVVAGHLDGNEKASSAMIREVLEESGITLNSRDMQLVHIMHRKSEEERIDFFFVAKKWKGKLKIMEPDKCDHLAWFPIDRLPKNIVEYIKTAIEKHLNNVFYSEFGWEELE